MDKDEEKKSDKGKFESGENKISLGDRDVDELVWREPVVGSKGSNPG